MTNTMATNAGLPNFTVFFRRNTDGSCEHTVFEYGNPLVTVQPVNMGAYTATISKAGVVLHTENVPQHFWFGRWRWPQSPYHVTAKVSDLIASGLLPHYDASVLDVKRTSSKAFTYTPMTLAGLTAYMGSTGERGDIGPVTEWQADYICVGANLPTVLAQAEASGTFPWNIRDPLTVAPFDMIKYPKASMYAPQSAGQGNPYVFGAPKCMIGTQGITTDTSHEPALNYLPFMLTGDPYYLEGLQFQAVYDLLATSVGYRYSTNQVRSIAWRARNLGQAAKVTPAAVPSWLLPQSNLATLMAALRDWLLTTFVDSTTPPYPVFRTIRQNLTGGDQVWQGEFVAAVTGWLVQMGYKDWLPIHTWVMGSTIARTNGTSGWLRGNCTPYVTIYRHLSTDPWAPDWGTAWAINVEYNTGVPYAPDPSDPGGNTVLVTRTPSMTYPSYTRGALAIAQRLGVAGADAAFAWLDGQIKTKIASGKGYSIDRKWMIT